MAEIKFYTDPKEKLLDASLFSDKAEDLAKVIRDEQGPKKQFNKRSQLHKFYDEVVRLNGLARSNPADWPNIHPYVNMIIAKAAYAEGRKLVSASFVSFLRNSVRQVESAQDLDVFASLFEAFMGFYRKYSAE